MMKFLVGSCEQRPMLRDGTVLRSSAVTIGTSISFSNMTPPAGYKPTFFRLGIRLTTLLMEVHTRSFIYKCWIDFSVLTIVDINLWYTYTDTRVHMNFLGELKHPCRHDAQNDSEVRKITHTFSIKKLISQQPFIRFVFPSKFNRKIFVSFI